MEFTSLEYFLYLAPAVVVYYFLPGRLRNFFLIIISLLFLIYANPAYAIITLVLIVLNYLIGLRIEKAGKLKKKKLYLYLSLILNLGVLIFFKYWNFIISNIFYLLGWADVTTSEPPLVTVMLPIGLSYYTFQTVGYIYDVYRGNAEAEKGLLNFGLFTIFFSKLPVGPIERSNRFLKQLKIRIYFQQENIVEGGKRIAWGLFKKLVVADRIAIYEDAIFRDVSDQSGITLLVGSLLYTVQVYADFSGYTDIALGTARLFGFNLVENFKQPLFARNVGDFWRRWHISLSSWVNDYIFNPIVFNRRYWGNWGIFYALLVSFLVIGIWHGASWNYVLFGLIQALALIIEASTRKKRKNISGKLNTSFYLFFSIASTFLFVTFSLVIFRFQNFNVVTEVLSRMFTRAGSLFIDEPPTIVFIIIGCLILFMKDLNDSLQGLKFFRPLRRDRIYQSVCYSFLLIYILLAGVFGGGQFIYFAF